MTEAQSGLSTPSTGSARSASAPLELPKQFVGFGLSQSVLQCAYIFCAISAAAVVSGFLCPQVITRFGPGPVMAGAGVVMAADFFALAYAHDQVWQYVVTNLAWGAAFAFGYSAAYAAVLQAAAPSEAAMYSSTNSVFSTGIASIGPGIFTAVLTSHTIPNTPIPTPGVFRTLWLYAAFAGVAVLVLALFVRRSKFVSADPSVDAMKLPDTADSVISADGDLQERPEPA